MGKLFFVSINSSVKTHSRYARGSGFSPSIDCCKKIEASYVWVNCHGDVSVHVHFGRFNQPVMRRVLGEYACEQGGCRCSITTQAYIWLTWSREREICSRKY